MVEALIYEDIVKESRFDPLAPYKHWVLPEDVEKDPNEQE